MFTHATRSIDDRFYRSPRWKKCRAAYIKHRQSIDGGICEICHEQPGRIVHHRIHLTPDVLDDPDICFGFGNLELVCLDCHNIEHGYVKPMPERMVRYAFDPEGNPIPASPPEKF